TRPCRRRKVREKRRRAVRPPSYLRCDGLGLAPAAGGRAAGHPGRTQNGEVCFLRSATCGGKGQAPRGAPSFVGVPAAPVTNKNGLPCQFHSFEFGFPPPKRSEMHSGM